MRTLSFAVEIDTTAPDNQCDPNNYFSIPQSLLREVRLAMGKDTRLSIWQGGENGEWVTVTPATKPVLVEDDF